ncbi:MAG: glycosyltransferase [Clostridiales bacterium]|nr:glycosyltransferase [Clostridiales bacterium]
MKKLMILTSVYTGHGHKSISDSLAEAFQQYSDLQVDVAEAFLLIGEAGIRLSKMYGPMTRNARELWKLTYALSNRSDHLVSSTMSGLIHDRFMQKLSQSKPDMILTVHPMFNGSVLNILDYYGIDVPLIALQADIINIHRTWCDPRAHRTLCPTEEAYAASIAMDMPPERLVKCGFPTRAQFIRAAQTIERREYDGVRPLECLMMSGGEGSGNMQRYAVELLNRFNCNIDILCGRNAALRRALDRELTKKYGARVRVHGFVADVETYMMRSDLVIARGSPNSLMEAVVCNVPVLITGALPGQEADNPSLMERHHLGVMCPSPSAVKRVVSDLVADGGAQLKDIIRAQREYRNFDNAKNIADLVYREIRPLSYQVPPYRLRFHAPDLLASDLRTSRTSARRLPRQ